MTPKDNIYILLMTSTAFSSFFWSEFYFSYKLFISYIDSYIRLGPPALVRLRWPEPIYMRVGYVFESRFSAGNI